MKLTNEEKVKLLETHLAKTQWAKDRFGNWYKLKEVIKRSTGETIIAPYRIKLGKTSYRYERGFTDETTKKTIWIRVNGTYYKNILFSEGRIYAPPFVFGDE